MPDSIKLISVALGCLDAGALGALYAGITGGKVPYPDEPRQG